MGNINFNGHYLDIILYVIEHRNALFIILCKFLHFCCKKISTAYANAYFVLDCTLFIIVLSSRPILNNLCNQLTHLSTGEVQRGKIQFSVSPRSFFYGFSSFLQLGVVGEASDIARVGFVFYAFAGKKICFYSVEYFSLIP